MSRDQRNFWADILTEAGGEPLLGVVIGDAENGYHGPDKDDPRAVPVDCTNVVLDAAAAKTLLEYEYDAGFGGADCHAVYAWTETRVLFVAEYDGSTSVESVPRHPAACKPVMT